jgi:hypothetical protein
VPPQVVEEEHGEYHEGDHPQGKTDQDDPFLVDLQRLGIGTALLIGHGSTIGRSPSGRLTASTSGQPRRARGGSA